MRVGACPIETSVRPHFSSGREPGATATAGNLHPQPVTGEKWRLTLARRRAIPRSRPCPRIALDLETHRTGRRERPHRRSRRGWRCVDPSSWTRRASTPGSTPRSRSPPRRPASTGLRIPRSQAHRSSPSCSEPLVEMLAGCVVIGQSIRFDLAVLRHEAARAGLPWHDPPALDVAHLAGALDRGLVDLGLESLANRFGVTIEERHDALGDSLAAARILHRARSPVEGGGHTDPRRGAGTRGAPHGPSSAARWEAGWHAMPGAPAVAPSPPPAGPRRQLPLPAAARRGDARSRAVESLPGGSLREAARIMTEERIGALLVTGGEPRPAGIVTERDLLRGLRRPGHRPRRDPGVDGDERAGAGRCRATR